jgi:uroporphyrinogen-III synthase
VAGDAPTVMLLRVAGRREELRDRLAAGGVRVVDAPITRHEPLDDAALAPLDALLTRGEMPEIVIVTSAEAARVLAARAEGLGTSLSAALGGTLVAVVGPATARALAEAGRYPDLLAGERRAEGVVAALRDTVLARVRTGAPPHVALVRALEGRPELADGLEKLGARVTLAPAYRTVLDPGAIEAAVERLEAAPPALIVATSGRPVNALGRRFRERTGRDPALPVAALGPVTADAARAAGFTVALVAPEADASALAAAVQSHFRKDSA